MFSSLSRTSLDLSRTLSGSWDGSASIGGDGWPYIYTKCELFAMLSSLHWLCCSAFEFALTLFALHSSLHWLWEAICAAPPAATRPSPLPPSVANPRRFSGPCMVLDVNNILLVDISSRFEQCQWIICSTGPDLCDLYSMTWGGWFWWCGYQVS